MKELQYVRTDRNGTKYYADWNCPRCGGAGQSDKWQATGRRCYECGGSGLRRVPKTVKVYLPEYEAKLDAKRAERAAKRAEAIPAPTAEELKQRAEAARLVRYANAGCNSDGIGYVYEGKTYSIRDAIKNAGGQWIYGVWVAPVCIEVPKTVTVREINANEHLWENGDINIYEAIYG